MPSHHLRPSVAHRRIMSHQDALMKMILQAPKPGGTILYGIKARIATRAIVAMTNALLHMWEG